VKTAALIIIGDEILTGKVKDENSLVFAKLMFSQGIELKRIIIIPDEVAIIASSVREFCNTYDYVASSGGIGPTHDDMTLEGVSLGLNKKLCQHDEALSYFQAAQESAGRGSHISDIQLKMLTYPESSHVYFAKPMWLGLIRVNNLYILPGVPSLFKRLLEAWAHLFVGDKFFRQVIYTDRFESSIAADLAKIQTKFSTTKIGSYPQEPDKSFRVIVTIEGREEQRVLEAAREILPLIQGRIKI
jgi:molybdenum cofactor synthesis domain-containing protein